MNHLYLTLKCPHCEEERLMKNIVDYPAEQYQDDDEFQICMECEECNEQTWWTMKIVEMSDY